MNKYDIIPFIIIISLISLFMTIGYSIGTAKKPPILNTQPQVTIYEITLECQKLSAMTTKEDWGYKNCVEELRKSLGGQQLAI